MFGLGITELVVILVVALIVFGPGRLPEIGGALGRGIRDFRKAFESEDKEQIDTKQDTDEPQS